MDFSNHILGKSGEQIAVLFFQEKGYQVAERNWRCKAGEIDLIVRRGDEWRCVEVKTRSSVRYGQPEEALTWRKREHLHKAIEWFVLDKGLGSPDIHADVISIIINAKDFAVRWLPDAA